MVKPVKTTGPGYDLSGLTPFAVFIAIFGSAVLYLQIRTRLARRRACHHPAHFDHQGEDTCLAQSGPSMATAGALMAAGALCASAASAAPVLYGATGVAADDTLPASNLYTINPDTGAATSIGSIGEAITGLAFDNADGGKLYGVTGGVYLSGKERKLLRINPATGASTVVGSLGANEIEDIAFTALGQLYGWNETGDDLYRSTRRPAR